MTDLKASLDRIKAVDALFDKQVEKQIALSYHVDAGLVSPWAPFSAKQDAWRELLEPLRNIARKSAGLDDAIPFVIVIPHRIVPIERQLFGVTVKSESARSTKTMLAALIRNVRNGAPIDAPYLIFKVRDGSDLAGLPPKESATRLRAHSLLELTAEEGLASATHYPGILKGRTLTFAGSRCGILQKVPRLSVERGRPELSYDEESVARPDFCTPYCEELLTA